MKGVNSMGKLAASNIEELIKELSGRGHFLKSAGSGVFIQTIGKIPVDKEIKTLVYKHSSEIIKYLEVTSPNAKVDKILSLLGEIDDLAPNVKHLILDDIHEKLINYINEAKYCDSPLEFELFFSLKRCIKRLNQDHSKDFWIHTQYPLSVNGSNYRADILICEIGTEGNTNYPHVVIECDGHDFHEKSKEQVQRDKKRDRDLQLAGYRVIRFTGSEIFKNAYKCARETTDFIKTII
jgi:very-short-patch-repair endonuclease